MLNDAYARLDASLTNFTFLKYPIDSAEIERLKSKLVGLADTLRNTGYSLLRSFVLYSPDAGGTIGSSGQMPNNQQLYDMLSDEQRRQMENGFRTKIQIAVQGRQELEELLPVLGIQGLG